MTGVQTCALPIWLLRDAVTNLQRNDEVTQALKLHGVDLAELEEIEPDAALGNGGLGRLAACFMESMASLALPAYGYGIRYVNGMFRQRIDDGWQVEMPENWLAHGNPWEFERRESAYFIGFGGEVTASESGQIHWSPTEAVEAIGPVEPATISDAVRMRASALCVVIAVTPGTGLSRWLTELIALVETASRSRSAAHTMAGNTGDSATPSAMASSIAMPTTSPCTRCARGAPTAQQTLTEAGTSMPPCMISITLAYPWCAQRSASAPPCPPITAGTSSVGLRSKKPCGLMVKPA